jgi:hypothetical protein
MLALTRLAAAFSVGLCALSLTAAAQVAELVQLEAEGQAVGRGFGRAVAISGKRALVGAELDDDTGTNSGAVHVFERAANGEWAEVAKLTGEPFLTGKFGLALALRDDRAVIGAPSDFSLGIGAGAAYIYERSSGGEWVRVKKLLPVGGANGLFGTSVALTGDRVLVGAPRNDTYGIESAGLAHAYHKNPSGDWIHVGAMYPTDPDLLERFGTSIAASGDHALVGATRDNGATRDSGTVLSFTYDGTLWLQGDKLSPIGLGPDDDFGASLSMTSDWAAVGAPGHDGSAGTDAGTVWILHRGIVWNAVQELTPSDGQAGDRFGTSVAMEGTRLLVSAPFHDATGTDAGAVYVFERDALGTWIETEKLVASDGAAHTRFGNTVALSGENTLVGVFDPVTAPGTAVGFDLVPLSPSTEQVSLGAGGQQRLELNAGHLHAGELYWLFGSATGTSPGLALGGDLTLPLNVDGYFLFTLANPNTVPLASSLGFTNEHGFALAAFALPAGTSPGLAGATLHHALVTLDVGTLTATFASNAVAVALVP